MHPPGIPNPTRARHRKNCMYAFWGGHVGAAAGCCCRVLLQGAAAVRVVCALQGLAGCRCKVLQVLLSEWRVEWACWRCRRQGTGGLRVPVQGTTVKPLSTSPEPGCCYRVLLSECGARFGGGCEISMAVGDGPDGDDGWPESE